MLHFLKIIVCYMERNVANGYCTCYFISKVLSLPLLQNTSPAWTKQRALTAPPYNNELGHCLLTGVTSHIFMMVACGCTPTYEAKGSLIFGLCDSNLLKGRAYSGSQNLKVARLIMSTGTLLRVLLNVYVHDIIPQGASEEGKHFPC